MRKGQRVDRARQGYVSHTEAHPCVSDLYLLLNKHWISTTYKTLQAPFKLHTTPKLCDSLSYLSLRLLQPFMLLPSQLPLLQLLKEDVMRAASL